MIATTTAVDSATLLEEAQVLYNEKEYSAALKKLNQFFEYSTDKGDEALYLKGQILEAKSDVRDIKGAIDAYTTLTKNYPASKLWDSANKRIIYLKRFYLEVR
jgi:outer membrane protein assembly factor BamD (BamD/ComL family)